MTSRTALAVGALPSVGAAGRRDRRSILPDAGTRPVAMASVGRGGTAARRCVPESGGGCDPDRRANRGRRCHCCLGQPYSARATRLLARFGAAHRKRCGECVQQPAESQQPGSGVAIALGNALDAAPEAMVLGIALRDPVVPLALVIAFSLGNLPVALSSTAGMRAAGRSYAYIFLLWSAIAIGAAVAIVAGYVGFGSLGEAWPPAAAGIWSRSTARDGCGNDDSRGLPQQSAFLRLARRLRFRPPAACRRYDTLETLFRYGQAILGRRSSACCSAGALECTARS